MTTTTATSGEAFFDLQELLSELERRKVEGGWSERYFNTPTTFDDYPKHHAFFKAGARYRTRIFTAGNQVGKSTTAACELVMHATGIYPAWWEGHRFVGPVNGWIVGKSSELVRQTLQVTLLGPNGAFGTGLIPASSLDIASLTDAKKASTGISNFRVKHVSGGYSTFAFKSGEQGREAFQAATLDLVWCDEEIPYDVFNECQVRLMVRKGLMLYTFTPLKGSSEIITSYSRDGEFVEGAVDEAYIVRCSMRDVKHISAETIADLERRTPPFLRQARIDGIPSLGSGAIYPVAQSEYVVDDFAIPAHYPRLYGMDVGGKTAAVWLAQNPDTKQWFAYNEYYKEREEPSIHATAIKSRGDWIPGAIDPAARGRSQIDGKQLMQLFNDQGLSLSDALNAVEAGLYTVWELLSTDQLKVFKSCVRLLQEMRTYSRDEKGHVIKKNDHLCFIGETPIWTKKDGLVPIQELVGKTGQVLSTDGYQPFENVALTRRNAPVVTVVFEDGEVTCTPDHQFLTTCGWVEAKDLKDTKVRRPNQPPTLCLEVREEGRTSDVFCLSVPTTRALTVGPGVIAHNCDALRYAVMTRDIATTQRHQSVAPLAGAFIQPIRM